MDDRSINLAPYPIQKTVSKYFEVSCMKTICLVMGLISAIFLLDKTTVTASQRDIMFVLDNSGSMYKNDPDIITDSIVSTFVTRLHKVDRVGIIIFDESARLAAPLTLLDNPIAHEELSDSLAQMNFHGQLTNTPVAIERAIYELRVNGRKDSQRSIIFFTDGIVDTGDVRKDLETTKWLIEDLTAECVDFRIKIFSVAYTEKADFHLIQSLSDETKGAYFRISSENDISKTFQKIIELQTADTSSIPETTAKAVYNANQSNNLNTNITRVKIKQKEPDYTLTSLLQNLIWTIFILIAISAPILLLYLFFRQKKIRSMKIIPDEPIGDDDSQDFDHKAQLIDMSSTIVNSSEPPLLYLLDKHKTTIGRDNQNMLVIPKPTVSNFHATIQYVNGYFQLEDNHSTNGTFLENNRLTPNQPVRLKHGDVVKFATFDFRFLHNDSASFIETTMLTERLDRNDS
jgi:Mg-chelatase subunit ChlD